MAAVVDRGGVRPWCAFQLEEHSTSGGQPRTPIVWMGQRRLAVRTQMCGELCGLHQQCHPCIINRIRNVDKCQLQGAHGRISFSDRKPRAYSCRVFPAENAGEVCWHREPLDSVHQCNGFHRYGLPPNGHQIHWHLPVCDWKLRGGGVITIAEPLHMAIFTDGRKTNERCLGLWMHLNQLISACSQIMSRLTSHLSGWTQQSLLDCPSATIIGRPKGHKF